MSLIPLTPVDRFAELGLVEPARDVYRDMRFVPTTVQLMAARPEIARGYLALAAHLIRDTNLDRRLIFLVATVSSRAAECRYCTAHAARMASLSGTPLAQIIAAVQLEFDRDDLFSARERAAMRLARDGSIVPNAVAAAHQTELGQHFSDDEVLQLTAQIALMGFLNRFNDILAAPLEPESLAFAEEHLKGTWWSAGKHGVATPPRPYALSPSPAG